jgi:neutral ceramidase
MKDCLPLILLFWVTALSGASGIGAAEHQNVAGGLRAGAATSNITPELGGDIVGGFVPVPCTDIHDELHARCLVLDDGKELLALVVCDLLGLHRSVCVEAKRLIEEATGIPHSHVLISATHTHSAVNALGERVRGYQSDQPLTDYQRFVARRISDGVRRALAARRPAEIGFGSVDVPEHVFNRRWFMKEGAVPQNPFGKVDRVKMNPPSGSPDLLEPAGPTDPAVSFIALREPGGRMISIFSAYSLHYVGGVGAGHISADYFGFYCDALKRLQAAPEQDPPFVALLANGTSGDINNINFRVPRKAMPAYEQIRKVAEDLAMKVQATLATLEWKTEARLAARLQELPIRWRVVEAPLLAWARETEQRTQATGDGTSLPALYSGRVQRLAQASTETRAPAQVLRIGDIAIGTSPCETFAETGLEFKKRSPFKHSFMVELANGYYGYLPTPRHFELGGYETWPGTNYLEREASVKLMESLLGMARELEGSNR